MPARRIIWLISDNPRLAGLFFLRRLELLFFQINHVAQSHAFFYYRAWIVVGEKVCYAGAKEALEYRQDVSFLPWMVRSRIIMREDVANCCDAPVSQGETPLAELDFVEKPFLPDFRYVALLSDSTIERSAEGRAFVDFIVNRTEIRPTYRRNTMELAKIIESIDKVKNDPDATITRVTIKGFASPEGSYSNNVRLAMGRTASLKEYVREHYNFDPEIMFTDYEPEDWAGLRAWVEDLHPPSPHRDPGGHRFPYGTRPQGP